MSSIPSLTGKASLMGSPSSSVPPVMMAARTASREGAHRPSRPAHAMPTHAVAQGQGQGQGQEGKIRKTAQDFEAMALGEMLQPMFETVDNSAAPFGGGNAEKQFRSMQVLELGKEVARSGGVGIARQVYGRMKEMQEKAGSTAHGRRRQGR